MKVLKLSLLSFTLAFCAVSASVMAQNVTITPAQAYITGLPTETAIKAESWLQNNTTSDIDLVWVRENVQVPAGWETAVCDINLCWGPTLGTTSFTLPPTPTHNAGAILDLQFRPNGIEGSGSAEIGVYNASDNSFVLRGFYYGTAQVVGTATVAKTRVALYPNPATERITIANNTDIRYLTIYTVAGMQVREYAVAGVNQQFDIADLAQGAYLVQLLDKDHVLLQTIRFAKQGL